VINPCANAKSQNWIVRGMQWQVSAGPPYLCATVQGNKTASGTPVISSACNGGPGQLWDFENGLIYGVGTENGAHKCFSTDVNSTVVRFIRSRRTRGNRLFRRRTGKRVCVTSPLELIIFSVGLSSTRNRPQPGLGPGVGAQVASQQSLVLRSVRL
jgi:hypothetical protein